MRAGAGARHSSDEIASRLIIASGSVDHEPTDEPRVQQGALPPEYEAKRREWHAAERMA